STHREERRLWPSYIGLTLLAATVVLLWGTVRGWFDPTLVAPLLPPAMAIFLAGCVLILPLILEPLSRVATTILKPILGREGALALRQLIRHRARTALTVGVLLVAVVFAMGFGQSFLNNLDHIYRWFDDILVADFYIRGVWPDPSATITTAAVPEALGDE